MWYRIPIHSLIVLLILSLGACTQGGGLPDPSSSAYREAVSAFYTGLAAMEVGEDQRAEAKLTQVTELAPDEPAAWTNLGLLALRRNAYDEADQRLTQARALVPDNSHVLLLSGLLESNRGQPDAAVAYLRQAVALDSTSLKAAYALAQEIERQGGNDDEVFPLLSLILTVAPDNMAALIEQARLAAGRSDAQTLSQATARLADQAALWPPEATEQLDALQQAIAVSDFQQAATQVAFLRNVLLSLPAYRQDLAALQAPIEQVAEPAQRFVRLPDPRPTPAPPDDSLIFAAEPLLEADTAAWAWVGAIAFNGEGLPAVLVADGREIRTLRNEVYAFPGGSSAQPPTPRAVAGFDYNYDFRTDLALVGAGGLRLYEQDTLGIFTDVTGAMALPAAITTSSYTAAWAADFDLEGDVDLILATPDGPPQVLRNNSDGTFVPMPLFDEVIGLRDVAWADFDSDGDPDAALLDRAGTIHFFSNERQGRFLSRALPPEASAGRALAATDLNSDSVIDLVVLQADGAILRLSDQQGGEGWTMLEVARWPGIPGADDPIRLFTADLDNNGGFDLLASGPAGGQAWLQDEQYAFNPLPAAIDAQIFYIAAVLNPGQLDLVGIDAAGQPVRLAGLTTKGYKWKQIRPRAAQAVGDQRINSFGIGGEVELRTGLLYQKQPITQPILHFGLGDSLLTDVARITWPNGDVQAEFELLSDQILNTQQRLKGSCPWLFTYDGQGMAFVTDFIWRSPLGLRINAQETAGIMTTEDWVKIRGDQLVARDGFYDVRITAELWETHFFDHVSLMVVDHPPETEVFVDERFAFPPPPLAVNVTAPPQPVAGVWDDLGNDLTDRARARDERYLDFFGRGAYQGITRDHYVEIDLGEHVPTSGPLWLLATGWIRPTDSSINVAISHGQHAPPRGLRLDVPDGEGGWMVAAPNLGFPSGKAKTILIDLDGVFRPGTPRRVRLHTNLEIYWDAFAWATGRPAGDLQTQRLAPDVADLRYRGYSEVREANRSSPELPDYEILTGTSQVWRDLIGYYTRFGDVRELLAEIDDRYVIMNAGDEMVFRFPEPPPPPDGWSRDFVLIGDGWVKDGDYNTTFSKTVLPLPSHDQPEYTTPPGRLQDDPVYRRYPQDWQIYHTRYVTPQRFSDALRPR